MLTLSGCQLFSCLSLQNLSHHTQLLKKQFIPKYKHLFFPLNVVYYQSGVCRSLFFCKGAKRLILHSLNLLSLPCQYFFKPRQRTFYVVLNYNNSMLIKYPCLNDQKIDVLPCCSSFSAWSLPFY